MLSRRSHCCYKHLTDCLFSRHVKQRHRSRDSPSAPPTLSLNIHGDLASSRSHASGLCGRGYRSHRHTSAIFGKAPSALQHVRRTKHLPEYEWCLRQNQPATSLQSPVRYGETKPPPHHRSLVVGPTLRRRGGQWSAPHGRRGSGALLRLQGHLVCAGAASAALARPQRAGRTPATGT